MTAWKRRTKTTLARFTGVSAFGFGAQWDAKESDREKVRGLIVFLEDRTPIYMEEIERVSSAPLASLNRTRDIITETISSLSETSPAIAPLRVMRSAIQNFISSEEANEFFRLSGPERQSEIEARFAERLAELRGALASSLMVLVSIFDIDVDIGLASILPKT